MKTSEIKNIRLTEAEKRVSGLREDTHKRYDELLKNIHAFYSQAEKVFERMGMDFNELKLSASELQELNTRVEFHTRRAAINYGHLVSPNALDNLFLTLVSDTFAIGKIRGHQSDTDLQAELKRIDRFVEPQEKLNA